MSNKLFLIDGYMSDITAGEFRPSTDRNNKLHTLSRLIIATAEKGEFNESPINTPATSLYGSVTSSEYQPSWGGGIKSQIFHRSDYRARQIFEITGIRLTAPDTGDTFTLQKTSDDEASLIELDTDFILTLGQHLQNYRNTVAYFAEAFFAKS